MVRRNFSLDNFIRRNYAETILLGSKQQHTAMSLLKSKTLRPYGSWPSTLSAERVASKATRFGKLQSLGKTLYWNELRPEEKGRSVIMSHDEKGQIREILPAGYSARSRVHEYGGGDFLVSGRAIYFTNERDQDIYTLTAGKVHRLTYDALLRFADFAEDRPRNRLIAVTERHAVSRNPNHVENFLSTIILEGKEQGRVERLIDGQDFYANPRLSPDQRHLAWLAWDLPHMPWEAAALYCGEIAPDGGVTNIQKIAGGPGEAVFQPEWRADGRLAFACETTGWSNLYLWRPGDASPTPVHPMAADFSQPLWVLHMRTHAHLPDGRIVARFVQEGEVRLAVIAPDQGHFKPLHTPFADISELCALGKEIAAIGSTAETPARIVRFSPETDWAEITPIQKTATAPALPSEDISHGQIRRFASQDRQVHGIYYPPRNAAFEAPPGSKPPAIIRAHGGPSGMAERSFQPKIQFWTNRGFAVFDVDYAGSTGYGRDFREKLNGHWGEYDAQDIIAAGQFLIDNGLADPKRLIVSGSSAGGFTALMTLAQSQLFAAAAAYYAVTDLARLKDHMHKFEAGYIFTLTGLDKSADRAAFLARSPMGLADKIKTPVIFFQGLMDSVVPDEQPRKITATMKTAGIPVALIEFPDEGHGFRQQETITTVLKQELAFYAKVLGIEVSDDLPHLEISNESNIVIKQ